MTLVRRILSPLAQASAYKALVYLASGLPLGLAWAIVLIVGVSVGGALLVTLVGIPILLGMAYVVIGMAGVERALVRALLGLEVLPTARPLSGGILSRLLGWARDPARWREAAYVVIRGTAGAAVAVAVLAMLEVSLGLAAYPAYYWVGDGPAFGSWHPQSLPWALLGALVGLLLIPAVAWAVVGLAEVNRLVAGALLGRVPGRPVRSLRALRILHRKALAAHATFAGAVVIVCLGIWGATTPHGYVWPAWVALGLSIPLGVHAIAVLVPRPPGPRGDALRPLLISASVAGFAFLELTCIWALTTPGGYFWPAWALLGLLIPVGAHAIWVLIPARSPARRALATHAAASGLVVVVVTLIWAGTTPGGYFWPAWVLLGLLIPLGIHALVMALSNRESIALAERVEVLTSTRAAAVDAQAAELQRIERDLHDGAQARLTALAMELGMAREKLETEPSEATPLVAAAHEEAKRALVELRDLARGIHPAVLTDRGLDAALSALAGGSAVPVELSVRTDGRLPAAVEGAAYFVVAEALANAHKHSAATAIRVTITRAGDMLVITIEDDGVGGADPAGGGLEGLRRRVEALDGRLYVDSPPFQGTRVQAEIPCGS